ncbi:MAG: hypothetical protein Q9166_004031 [cf. Caloplaca sp. 2 TL-2023]
MANVRRKRSFNVAPEGRRSPAPHLQQGASVPLLATLIKKKDVVPQGWMKSKKGRHSVRDLQQLERYWEHKFKTNQPPQEVRRANSSGPASPVAERSRLVRWCDFDLPEHMSRRLAAKVSMLKYARKKIRAISTLSRRYGKDLVTKLKTRYDALPRFRISTERRNSRAMIGEIVSGLLGASQEAPWDTLSIFSILWSLGVVMIYSIISATFRSNFCQYELAVVRDLICGPRDLLLEYGQIAATEKLSRPHENILQSDDKTISSLPETEYPANDQAFFRERFAEFVGQCATAISKAQLFHSHIVGTIRMHVSNTRLVSHQLEDYGFMLSSPNPHNGVLAQVMVWFNSYYLIYLPIGIEPFQEASLQLYKAPGTSLRE